MIRKLTRVPLKEVWKNEAKDFTPWLEENIEALNEALDLSLSSAESEKAAGDFRVDLVAEDEDGRTTVIENQLGPSDHNHLGKLLTYLAALDAAKAIWIVADPSPEHVRAISWLNESSPAAFYLVKVEAVSIGESPPAPLFTLIVGPSEESQDVGETKKELVEQHALRKRFWTGLLEVSRRKAKLFANISPGKGDWVSAGAGLAGVSFEYVVRKHYTRVELYINRGKEAENKALFDRLASAKKQIEATFGEPLEWVRLEGKIVCRIRKQLSFGGLRDEDKWPDVYEKTTDAMVRFEKALKPHLAKLKE